MPTPFTDAPLALLHLWNKFVLRGDLDGSTPPATMQEAYNQVVAIQLRQMREGVQAINEEVQHLLGVDGPGPPTCCVCGASPLTKYVASLHTGATYLPGVRWASYEVGLGSDHWSQQKMYSDPIFYKRPGPKRITVDN